MSQSLQVDVQVATAVASAPNAQEIRDWLSKVVEYVNGSADREMEISVKLVDEDEGRDLNREFRDQDKATNVLSFPFPDRKSFPVDLPLSLGDIVICAPVVEREATEQGKKTADHWAHMLVHGALHLFGYDHLDDDGAREMETLEVRILASRGIGDPYEMQNRGSADDMPIA